MIFSVLLIPRLSFTFIPDCATGPQPYRILFYLFFCQTLKELEEENEILKRQVEENAKVSHVN